MEREPQLSFTSDAREDREREKIKLPAIKELRKPIQNILEQLREKIDRGEYNVVIGDDASGRVPALTFYNFLKEIYDAHSFPPPEMKFFAGSTNLRGDLAFMQKTADITEKLKKWCRVRRREGVISAKVLVVTDTIISGKGIEPLANALRENDIDFDIIAIGFYSEMGRTKEEAIEAVGERFQRKFVYGMLGTPSIYNMKELSGVSKKSSDIFATPLLKEEQYQQHLEWREEDQEVLRTARKDAKILAHELAEWYQKTSDSGTQEPQT